jgi:protein-L-isoaspartate O-methyltransferase
VPPALLDQLAVLGRLVIPVGEEKAQKLVRITRGSDGRLAEEDLGPVRFVPLIGADVSRICARRSSLSRIMELPSD